MHVPANDSLHEIQASIREIMDEIRSIRKDLDDAPKGGGSSDVDALLKRVASIERGTTTLDFNDVFRGSGPAHAMGYVPDPGDGASDERVLLETGQFNLPLRGLIRPATNVGVLGESQLPGDILSVLASMALTGNLGAAKAFLWGLEVIGGPGFINLRARNENITPLVIESGPTVTGVGLAPNVVSGLTAWYKADAQTGYADNDTLTTVIDSGSGGFTLNSVTGTPKYRTNVKNGKPAFQSANNGDIGRLNIGAAAFMAAGAGTCFAVIDMTTANAGMPWVISESGVAQRANLLCGVGDTISAYNNDGALDNTANRTLTTNQWYIVTWHHESGNLYCGTSDARTASMTSVASGNTNWAAGDDVFLLGSGGANRVTGYVAEVAFFNVALSEANRQEVETWLGLKYAITLPYSLTTYGNVDVALIRGGNGTELLRVSNAGDLYVKGVKVNVP